MSSRAVSLSIVGPEIALFRNGYETSKRCFDVAVCLLALPVALVLMAFCALLIALTDPGPLFFSQPRTGRGGRRFEIFKFRTMVANASELKEQYAHLNSQTGPDFKIPDDPRITPIGGFLRRSSLDELPQIWNVLRGDMSLVGPRPTSFDASTYELWHTERLEVTPGLTGLWQVGGRSELDFDERVRLDIEYVRKRSFWFDLRILLRTPEAMLRQRGAY